MNFDISQSLFVNSQSPVNIVNSNNNNNNNINININVCSFMSCVGPESLFIISSSNAFVALSHINILDSSAGKTTQILNISLPDYSPFSASLISIANFGQKEGTYGSHIVAESVLLNANISNGESRWEPAVKISNLNEAPGSIMYSIINNCTAFEVTVASIFGSLSFLRRVIVSNSKITLPNYYLMYLRGFSNVEKSIFINNIADNLMSVSDLVMRECYIDGVAKTIVGTNKVYSPLSEVFDLRKISPLHPHLSERHHRKINHSLLVSFLINIIFCFHFLIFIFIFF